MAKCRIDSFRLTGTGSMCHMFLLTLNSLMRVGFGFSSVTFRSRVFHSRVFSHPSVDTDEESTGSCPHLYQTFKMLWQFLCADSVFVRFDLQYTLLKSFTVPSAVLTKFARKFHTKHHQHFHKIVHENTFALTPLCFIWVSRAIAKHTRIVLTVFCQCSRLIVNGITESSNI